MEKIPEFPDPQPQDSLFFHLLHDPRSILWWMKIYEHKTGDQRYRQILEHCKHILPNHCPWYGPDYALPFFPNMPKTDPGHCDAHAHRAKMGLPKY